MAETGARIPKIIHQMWIGDNPKPTEWIKTFEDFCKEHGFQHMLWTEENLGQLEWDTFPGLKALYDSFGKIYNGKSDVLRYLALYSKGGIYIDADMVVVKPQQFADFLRDNTAPIFFGYEELSPVSIQGSSHIQNDLIEGNKLIASSVIGSKAKHPFMEAACREIMENEKKERTQDAWISVGPLFITRHYNKYKGTYPDIKVYPMKYFFPIKWHNITDPELHKKIDMPPESMLFQYGYTTNNFAKIFRERAAVGQKGGRQRGLRDRRTRRRLKRVPAKHNHRGGYTNELAAASAMNAGFPSGDAETGAGIPKIIHQVWIGDNPKPTEWIKTFEDFCKEYGFQHILWTEENLEQLEWDTFPGLKALYDSFGKIYNGKSDVLRYLALYSKGGIYIDADTVLMKPQQFADFLRDNTAPIFFGYEELSPKVVKQQEKNIGADIIEGNKLIAAGTIGSKAKHPFMEAACREIMENAKKEQEHNAWISVGPVFITRHYNKYKNTYPDIKVYPMKYFYPIKWHNITDPELHKKITIPPESMLFQYGYMTNNFAKIFRERAAAEQKGGRQRGRTRRRLKNKKGQTRNKVRRSK